MLYVLPYLCERLHIKDFEWIYTEAGHGKGPADGVGAAIKRRGNRHVATGGTISCASDLMELLSESRIFVKCVSTGSC